jgi:pimeloyl-ACP methyl ester carboxylesterase
VARGLGLLPLGLDIVIAHSFGAIATLEALARGLFAPPRALVLVSPFYRPSPHDFRWETLDYYVSAFHLVFEEGMAARLGQRRPPKRSNLRDLAVKVRERVGVYGWTHFFRAYLATPGLALSAIDVPVLVLGGGRDSSAFPADAHALVAALPRATCTIFDHVGHFLFLQDPDAFITEVENFFATTESPPNLRPTALAQRPSFSPTLVPAESPADVETLCCVLRNEARG